MFQYIKDVIVGVAAQIAGTIRTALRVLLMLYVVAILGYLGMCYLIFQNGK